MDRVTTGTATALHASPVADIPAALGTDLGAGLTTGEAAARLERDGPNILGEDRGSRRLETLANQFKDVLIWLLLAAAFISGVLLDEWIDTGVILAIVVLNALLGYVQEARAEDALARLKELAAPEAVVVRDGAQRSVPSRELVLGDLLVLEAGVRVAADARIVEAIRLEVEEVALTGESFPELKQAEPVDADTPLADRTSMLYSGTTVLAGRGRAIVAATGFDTEMGRIAGLLDAQEPQTPLQVELARVGRRLAVLAVVTAAVVFGTGTLRGNDADAMLLTAVALAVAAIPEGLPAVVTITLSRGVQRMADENAVVRRLPAVEALGAASVICTDKTGTLTRNEIRVRDIVFADGRLTPEEADPTDRRIRLFAEIAALNNDARFGDVGLLGDPTETALLLAVEDVGIDPEEVRRRMPRLDEVAFDSRRKRMTTLHQMDDGRLVAVKGAPEVVVERAIGVAGLDGTEPLDDARRARVIEVAAGLAEQGWRTLALAYRTVPEDHADLADLEEELVLVGVVGMSDLPRDEAAPAVAQAEQAGIRVVMVTGDHQITAAAVARTVGILGDGGQVMPGNRLRGLDVAELAAEVDRYDVYARVDPVDKVKIVDAWQEQGAIVAMTGDGVNDAPALRAADIGVAMGTGTDVSKDAAAMVLADDNFATIVSAVRQGRVIFTNLKKVVYFLLSCNASEVILMFFGFLVFGSLGEPLVAVQILWINLVTDGLPALALGIDPPEPGVMDRPPDEGRNILSLPRLGRLLVLGAILGASALASLVAGHYALDLEWPLVQTMIFTTLVVVQLLHTFNVRNEPLFTNPLLWVSVVVSFGLQLAVVYTPVGNTLFDTEPLGWAAWTWIAVLSLASFAVIGALRRVRPDLVPS